MRTIVMQPGLGDSAWVLMKLINCGEQFKFHLPDGIPRRGKQIFDLLPQVSASCEYRAGINYKIVEAHNMQKVHPLWNRIKGNYFHLSMNGWLERGNRIEGYFPDLPTSFRMPWFTSRWMTEVQFAFTNFHAEPFADFIGIYGSAYSTQRAWGFWDENKWLELIEMTYEHNPKACFVIIGAEWDLDLGTKLIELLEQKRIPYINTIGKELGFVIEVMKHLKYFFSFPSGLGILAPTVGCPVTMFYPPHLKDMMGCWGSPDDIASGLLHETLFCEPKEVFDWVVKNEKI